jgi:predicted phage terminase large subunit-like protein
VAAKAKEQHDFTVFCVWAVTPAKEILLLYVFRAHLRIPKQIEEGYKVYLAYLDDRFQAFWFEDVAYQGAFGQFMLEKGVSCEPFHPKGDKVLRAGGASIWMKLGNVYFLKHASWLELWRKEIYLFPKDTHDDQVDNLSMIVIIVKQAKDVEAMDEETAQAIRNYAGY